MLVLLRWWFIFCASAFGAAVAGSLGFFTYLHKADGSYLGIVTIATFAISSLWVGQLTYRSMKDGSTFAKHLPFCWYLSEVFMGFGMLGTLIGFLLLLGNALGAPINVADTAAMTQLISKMGVGFSTAAITTVVGLVCSLLFKLQLINLEYLKKEADFADTQPAAV
jgi:hypothetical protein